MLGLISILIWDYTIDVQGGLRGGEWVKAKIDAGWVGVVIWQFGEQRGGVRPKFPPLWKGRNIRPHFQVLVSSFNNR